MATWIWVIDANAGTAGSVKTDKAAYLSFWFNLAAKVVPVYTMATVFINSVPDMVNQVIGATGGDKISRLILTGHGKSGVQGVGCGEGTDINGPTLDFLMVDPTTGMLKNNQEARLNQLVPYFANDARVSLAGCNVAASPDGPPLLERISLALFGITVEAGILVQNAWAPGYIGPVVRCTNGFCTTIRGPLKEIR